MEITLWIAFSAGLAAFLSPCVLPLAPVYLASLAGPGVLEGGSGRSRASTFLHSLSFVIGFTIIFSLWGAGIGLIGSAISIHLVLIQRIIGGVLILFGALMLAALKVSWLNYEKRLNVSAGTTTSYLRSFLLGAVFPVAWIPCTSWQLGGILFLAGGSGTAWQGTYMLAVYSLGLGLPFLAMGLAFDFIAPYLKRISRYSAWIYTISGLLLIAVGVLVLTGNVDWFLSAV